MRKTFIQSLLEVARLDPNIIFVTGDLGYGVIDDFARELPDQFINSGISEQSMMGLAAGMASEGKKVFVYSIGNFSTLRCLEQIRNDVCAMNNSVVVVSVGAGYSYGSQGYTHHAIEDIAIMRALPNMEILIPSDSNEVRMITKYLATSEAPAYLRLGKDGEPDIHESQNIFFDHSPYEVASGNDGAVLCAGSISVEAVAAASNLRNKGIHISVFLIPSLNGLTKEFISQISRFPYLFSLEEHSSTGGLGSAILEKLNAFGDGKGLHIMAADQTNLSVIGSQAYLRNIKGISREKIESRVLELIQPA
jgi:transketolase